MIGHRPRVRALVILGSSNLIVNVFTGRLLSACISATTSDESAT